MSTVVVAVKRCTKCEETKPLTEFHRQSKSPDGRCWHCKPCTLDRIRRNAERRRAEMGEDAWREYRRQTQRRHRERTGNLNGKKIDRARRQAIAALIENHRDEFEHLRLLAKRGEL